MARRQKTIRVPVALPAESAPEHWLRTIRLSGFTLVILSLVILTVIVLAPSLRILIEQQQAIAELEQGVTDKEASVKELERDVARWSDPAYIEAQSRERLLYVYPGEYSYLVIDDLAKQATSDGAPISDRIQTTQVDWLASMLSSLFTAGLTDALPTEIVGPVIEGQQ